MPGTNSAASIAESAVKLSVFRRRLGKEVKKSQKAKAAKVFRKNFFDFFDLAVKNFPSDYREPAQRPHVLLFIVKKCPL
jgi:hypothetical protein